jgi:hypothetical protein
MGRSLGLAGQREGQKKILLDLLQGVTEIKKGDSIKVLPYRWKRE